MNTQSKTRTLAATMAVALAVVGLALVAQRPARADQPLLHEEILQTVPVQEVPVVLKWAYPPLRLYVPGRTFRLGPEPYTVPLKPYVTDVPYDQTGFVWGGWPNALQALQTLRGPIR
jgi:hypothetical protein